MEFNLSSQLEKKKKKKRNRNNKRTDAIQDYTLSNFDILDRINFFYFYFSLDGQQQTILTIQILKKLIDFMLLKLFSRLKEK